MRRHRKVCIGEDQVSLKQEIITIDDIAKMYMVSRRYARDVLTKKPGFPPPANGSTKMKPIWLEEHLRQYMVGESRTNPAQS